MEASPEMSELRGSKSPELPPTKIGVAKEKRCCRVQDDGSVQLSRGATLVSSGLAALGIVALIVLAASSSPDPSSALITGAAAAPGPAPPPGSGAGSSGSSSSSSSSPSSSSSSPSPPAPPSIDDLADQIRRLQSASSDPLYIAPAASSVVDCEGHWSACTAACETAGQRLWVQTQSPSGFGQQCPSANFAGSARADCAAGDGGCTGSPAPAPPGPPAVDCSGDSTTYSLAFDNPLTFETKTICVPSSRHPGFAINDDQKGRFVLTYTAESGEYRTTHIYSHQDVEVIGADPSGAKVNFRGGMQVGLLCGLTAYGANSNAPYGPEGCLGAASLTLDSLAFRGLRSAGGGGFYGGAYGVNVASDAFAPSGGAIAVGSVGTLTATDVEFSDNAHVISHSGSSHGGAVYVAAGGIAHFTRAAFTNNLAGVAPLTTADEGGRGGAIYAGYGSSLTLDDCQLTGNAAELGGGIYQNFKQGSQLSITGTTFSGNRVTDTSSNDYGGSGSQGVHRCDTFYGECPTSNPKLSDSEAVSAQPILIERP